MTAGVYMLVNTTTGKKYIGQSFDIENRNRVRFHDRTLQKESGPVYDAIREYGKDCWELSILWRLEDPDIEDARELLWQKEREFITAFDTLNPDVGYNVSFGTKPSEETKKKMSDSQRGEKNAFFGKKHTEETKKKIREARKRQQFSEETKKKMSDSAAKREQKKWEELQAQCREVIAKRNQGNVH